MRERASEIDFQSDPAQVRRAPWLLVTFVSLSVIGIIVEIVVLRAQMQSSASRDHSPKTDTSQESPVAVAPKSAVLTAKVEETVAPLITDTSVSNSRRGSCESEVINKMTNEASRLLRNRWQRAARAAIDIPSETIAPATSVTADPLAESLRQSILLERMASLDLVARQLEAGMILQRACCSMQFRRTRLSRLQPSRRSRLNSRWKSMAN